MPTFRSRVALLVAVSLSLFGGWSAPVVARQATPVSVDAELTVLGPDEDYDGLSRGEWDARQWQWFISMPPDVNPSFDPTGERCGFGQHGPVFFVPSGSPTQIKTCVVPEGIALHVFVGGAECSSVESPPFFGRDEEELRDCAVAATDVITEVASTIDGEEVADLASYRTTSPLFTMNFPEDNIFGAPPGPALSVSDSYSYIIAPPPPGEYEITLSTTGEDGGFLEATVRIIVEAPMIIEPEVSPEDGTPEGTPGS